MSGRLADKVALVTGAASGIGRAVTQRLTAEGADVFAVDINADGLDETIGMTAEAPGTAHAHRADVSDRELCREAVAECVSVFDKLDVLGNIAGIARGEHFVEVSEADYRRMMAVNVDAYFFLAQAAVPHLLETEGAIINIASNAGLMGQAYTVAYCMTKGAVVQLTRALAMEYAKTPLRVNAIAPGGVDTALYRAYQMPADVDIDLIGPYTGFRPKAQPEDIAALFAFLACDEARNIHGAILSSDGGLTTG